MLGGPCRQGKTGWMGEHTGERNARTAAWYQICIAIVAKLKAGEAGKGQFEEGALGPVWLFHQHPCLTQIRRYEYLPQLLLDLPQLL